MEGRTGLICGLGWFWEDGGQYPDTGGGGRTWGLGICGNCCCVKLWGGGKREIWARTSGGGKFGGNLGCAKSNAELAPGQRRIELAAAPECVAGWPDGGIESSGGRLRNSSGRSPPRARIAALSSASSGSSEMAGSKFWPFFWGGFGAVGLWGAFSLALCHTLSRIKLIGGNTSNFLLKMFDKLFFFFLCKEIYMLIDWWTNS